MLGILLVAWLLAFPATVLAQSEAGGQDGAEAVTADAVNEVARDLWCPLCSGVRLDACELKACAQMKDMIAIKLEEGESAENIQTYFVEQYGPQVLGEPPREGFNWLAWILPVVALVGGGYFAWSRAQQMMRPKPASDVAEQDASNPGARADQEANGEMDSYERKLDEELQRHG